MHPESMKHHASIWDGVVGKSHHITDVYWEGDITQAELKDVADQISSDWQSMELHLDPAHPCHGQSYILHRFEPDLEEVESEVQRIQAETELAGHFVWVHCCQNIYSDSGELVDESGARYQQVFHTHMFCTEFVSFDDIADQCDEQFGPGEWDEFEIYLDDELPTPVASYG